MSKYTIQEASTLDDKGRRTIIWIVGIHGEQTDANAFWEFKTREAAEAKVRELESKEI